MPRHPDFEKIYRAFMKRYCGSPDNECEKGKRVYYAWLNKMGLDDTKPYRKPQEKFNWAKSAFSFLKQDKNAKYYKVEALFPVVSMNNNVYTEEELIRAARTLIGKPVNLNHEGHTLKGVEIIDAEYEDGAVEVLLRVLKTAGRGLGVNICDMIDKGEIVHVSIEASCRNISLEPMDGEFGRKCEGLVFTGLALLTKDVLPGVPLTRIEPVERLVESFTVQKVNKMKEKTEKEQTEREWDTAFINSLPDAAFAVIEPAYKRGKTEDKRARHLPHHNSSVRDPDENSSVDLPHLRNALARVNQIEPVTDSISAEELRSRARAHLLRHAKALLPSYQKEGSQKEKEVKEEMSDFEELKKMLETAFEEFKARLDRLEQKLSDSEGIKKEGAEEREQEKVEENKNEEQTEEVKEEIETRINLNTNTYDTYAVGETKGDGSDEVKEDGQKLEEEKAESTEATDETVDENAEQEVEESEENKEQTEKQYEYILTTEGWWQRFRQLRNEGLSQKEAYNLCFKEMLETLEKLRKKQK